MVKLCCDMCDKPMVEDGPNKPGARFHGEFHFLRGTHNPFRKLADIIEEEVTYDICQDCFYKLRGLVKGMKEVEEINESRN